MEDHSRPGGCSCPTFPSEDDISLSLPLTRDDALDLAYDLIEAGGEEAIAGNGTEAQVLNLLAQTAMLLADRIGFGSIDPELPVH